ncbi:MAG: hypothetical protein IKA02_02135 [Clostridia bacterium]|nr:hypothetical protein [Clostridia bacterium]
MMIFNRIRVFRVTADGRCLLTYIPRHVDAIRNLLGGELDTIRLFSDKNLTVYIRRVNKNVTFELNKKLHGVFGDVVICAGRNGYIEDLSDKQYSDLIKIFCEVKKDG